MRGRGGFTLVELMVVVAIVGILAVLAVYGVSRYVDSSRTAEARNSLGAIAKAAVSSYEEERHDDTPLLSPGSSGAKNLHAFCASALNDVPASPAGVKGRLYQSSATDWSQGDRWTGWPCLRFSLTEPQRYQYMYKASPTGFIAVAEADFRGSSQVTSAFDVQGTADPTTGQLRVSQQLTESDQSLRFKPVP